MRLGRKRLQGGAAAVEFALVCMIMLPMMMGILQYGFYFNDSLQTRQAVRQAARLAVVQGATGCSGTNYTNQLVCYTKGQTKPVSGPAAAMVTAPNGWAVGNPLIVCEMVQSAGSSIGVFPVPNHGVVISKTRMSIESDSTIPTGFTSTGGSASDSAFTGQDWTWCN